MIFALPQKVDVVYRLNKGYIRLQSSSNVSINGKKKTNIIYFPHGLLEPIHL